jgi:uncharacterized protein (TIGR02145 family)
MKRAKGITRFLAGAALAATLASCGDAGVVAGGGASSETENGLAARIVEVRVDSSLRQDTLELRSLRGFADTLKRRLWGDSLHVLRIDPSERDFGVRDLAHPRWTLLPSFAGLGDSVARMRVVRTTSGGIAADLQLSRGCPAGRDCGLVRDSRDGRTYGWVRLGVARWLRENAAYGEGQPGVFAGSGLHAPFDASGKITNGLHYTWSAARDVACPDGWILAGSREWNDLESDITLHRAQQIRAVGAWTGAYPGTDDHGLGVRPSGIRRVDGTWSLGGPAGQALFWTSQEGTDTTTAWNRFFEGSDSLFRDDAVDKRLGLSVRCTSS